MVALRVAKELGLDKDPEFQPHSRFSALPEWHRLTRLDQSAASPQTREDPDKTDAQKLDRAADALLQNVKVERVALSYILTISVSSRDPAICEPIPLLPPYGKRIARTIFCNAGEAAVLMFHWLVSAEVIC
jgi:uncharacterized protein involved in exopolysaccharide biosynthesis